MSAADGITVEQEILPAVHPFVKNLLHDFRQKRANRWMVAKIKGEGKFHSSAFPDINSENVHLEWITLEEWSRQVPGFFFRWRTAMRLHYLPITLFPIFLVIDCYLPRALHPDHARIALLLMSVLPIHFACVLWNDYEDHIRGVDSPDSSGGSGVISKLWIPAVHIRRTAMALLLLGLAFSFSFLLTLPVATIGLPLVVLGGFSALLAASYSGWPFHYKYLSLGEPLIFLLTGPLFTATVSLVFFQDTAFLNYFGVISFPLSFLTVLRLHSTNTSRIPFDTMGSIPSMARSLGYKRSILALNCLLYLPFVAVCILFALKLIGAPSLAALFLLPMAIVLSLQLLKLKNPLDPRWNGFKKKIVLFHTIFGTLYCVGFLWK